MSGQLPTPREWAIKCQRQEEQLDIAARARAVHRERDRLLEENVLLRESVERLETVVKHCGRPLCRSCERILDGRARDDPPA